MKHALRIMGGLPVLGTLAVLRCFWLDRTETTTDAYVTGLSTIVKIRVDEGVKLLSLTLSFVVASP